MIKIEGTVEFKEPKLENTVNGFKALKAQIKEAKDELLNLEEGSDAFVQKAAEIGEMTNQVDDLNKSISTVSGAPIENLTGSFGLLSNQISNLDFKGAQTSLSSLFSVIAANPLTALAGAALLVWQNFDKINDVLGLVTPEVDENTQAMNANKIAHEKAKEAQDKYIESLNKQLELLSLTNAPLAEILNVIQTRTKAQVSAIDTEIAAKDKRIAKINEEIAAEAEALRAAQLRAAGTDDTFLRESAARSANLENQKAAIEAEKAALTDLALSRDLIIARGTKAEQDAAAEKEKTKKDSREKAKEVEAQDADDFISLEQQKFDYISGLEEKAKEKKKKDEEDEKVRLGEFAEWEKAARLTRDKQEIQDFIDKEKAKADADALALKQKQEGYQRFTEAVVGLSNLYYEITAANHEKGSKEEQKAAKQAFMVSKGLSLANAVISGIQGVQAAFSSGSAVPIAGVVLGPAYAIAAGIVAAANIAKIARTQFNPTSPSAPSIGSAPAAPSISVPDVTPPQAPTIQNPPTTALNPDGTPVGSVPVGVFEGDISDVTKRVNVLEGRSTF